MDRKAAKALLSAKPQTPLLETPGFAAVVRSRLELPPDPVAAREVAREYLTGPAGRAFVQSGGRFEHVPGEPAPRSDIIKAVQAFLYDDPAGEMLMERMTASE
ncbi:MAG: hypothetical protein AAFQ99_11900 [Pseudomonadota bacterium]